MNSQISIALKHTRETFKALADAVIPRTHILAEEYGKIQFFGALDSYIYEYVILSLNDSYTPLAKSVAEMLDAAAEQLIFMDGNKRGLDPLFPEGGAFAALSAGDRIRVLNFLDRFNGEPVVWPEPFNNDPYIAQYMGGILNRFIVMGYYSEWSGYGSSRLEPPDHRQLEHYPLSWKQIGYPGPSLGYRTFRVANMK
jgi:hypothetical protein